MKKLLLLLLSMTFLPQMAAAQPVPVSTDAVAIFAGGCFWCMESEFQDLKGVSDVTSGYAGEGEKPTYEQVSRGDTGFKEAVAITYNPSVVTYKQLLDIFWSNVDPFDDKGQFCDKGTQYQAAIYFATKKEDILARSSLLRVEEKFKKKVATQILPMPNFFPAEDYHQDFYEKNKDHYERYKKGCRREQTLEDIWGEDDAEEE